MVSDVVALCLVVLLILCQQEVALLLPLEELRAEVGALECEGTQDANLFEHDNTRRVFFVFLDSKLAAVEVEDWNALVHADGGRADDQIVHADIIVAVVGKQVHVSAVTVNIASKDHSTTVASFLLGFLVEILDDLLSVVDGGMQVLGWLLPSAVEVDAEDARAIVSVDHAVRVEHWDHLHDKLFTDLLSLRVV